MSRALLGPLLAAALGACAAAPSRAARVDDAAIAREMGATLDAWHAAAARADEAAYFSFFAKDAVFLGTDARERWDVEAFRAYAHPHFAKGKAWSFRAVRRKIAVRGDLAWFEENLETPNLGPARGSGVLVRRDDRWLIEQYVLSITVPNDRFREVRELLASPQRAP